MKYKQVVKLIIDIAMYLIFVALMQEHLWDGLHEWLGIALFTLFIVHTILNFRWYQSLFNDYYGTYRAMEEAYKEGWIRAIGVSNFYPDRLVDLCSFVEVKPAINQVETHIFQQQTAAHEYMEKYGVQHESWGPFAEGRKDFFTNPVLNEIGKKHDKSAAQVALRFLLQSDVVVIPKSTHKERMEENINVFDFALDASDMNAIRALDEKESLFFSHYDPAIAEMMIKLH